MNPKLWMVFVLALAAVPVASADTGSFTIGVPQPLADKDKAEVRIEVSNVADKSEPLAVRVVVTASDGSHPDGAGQGLYSDGRFFADGAFTVAVPAGETKVRLAAGPNYEPLEFSVTAKAGQRQMVQARLRKWFSPEDRGWFAGDNHVHARHDTQAVEEIKSGVEYVALQARANGMSFITDAGSPGLELGDLTRFDSTRFLFRSAQELRVGPFVGHLNSPGIRAPIPLERFQEAASRVLPGQEMQDLVHAAGGAIIYTHPTTPVHQLHWMGATEALSDAVLGKCADLMDVDGQMSEQYWFSVLNLGNRVGCGSYTDTSLTRRTAMSPGDRRVYCKADKLSYPGVVTAIRAGKTFATNGGPVFPFLSVAGRGPGEELTPEQVRKAVAEVEVQALYPLKTVELIWNGRVIHLEPVTGKDRPVKFRNPLPESGSTGDWLVLQARDERGNWAITSPVYVGDGSARRKGSSLVLLEVSNHTRYIQLRKDFFAHVIATVSPDDEFQEVELLRDGESVRRFRPADGSQRHANKAPVTEKEGEYGPGWEWAVRNGKTVHLQADWPVTETGWYRVRATTKAGRTIESDEIRFDATSTNSRALSNAILRGPAVEYIMRGYGSEMPLDRVKVPFAGDHWWYPDGNRWERIARFGETETVHVGGLKDGLAGLIRATKPRK